MSHVRLHVLFFSNSEGKNHAKEYIYIYIYIVPFAVVLAHQSYLVFFFPGEINPFHLDPTLKMIWYWCNNVRIITCQVKHIEAHVILAINITKFLRNKSSCCQIFDMIITLWSWKSGTRSWHSISSLINFFVHCGKSWRKCWVRKCKMVVINWCWLFWRNGKEES